MVVVEQIEIKQLPVVADMVPNRLDDFRMNLVYIADGTEKNLVPTISLEYDKWILLIFEMTGTAADEDLPNGVIYVADRPGDWTLTYQTKATLDATWTDLSQELFKVLPFEELDNQIIYTT